MSRRNIYVSEAREALFDEACQMAGSLSTAIDLALKAWVREVRAGWLRTELFERVVGRGAQTVHRQFHARDLGECEVSSGPPGRRDSVQVFQSASGRLATWHFSDPDWSQHPRLDGRTAVDCLAPDRFERWGVELADFDTLPMLTSAFGLSAEQAEAVERRIVPRVVEEWSF